MKFSRLSLAVLAAGAILAVGSLLPIKPNVVKPAKANVTIMCAPQLADTAAARTIGGTTSQIPSGSIYSLNGQGCTVAKQQDLNWFLSQGFSPGPPFGANCLFTTGVATGTTSFQVCTLPPNAYIQHIIYNNTTANAAGNLTFGTTSGGADVVAAVACAANCFQFTNDAALLKRIFSTTAQQPIFVTSSAWGSANLTVTIVFGYF